MNLERTPFQTIRSFSNDVKKNSVFNIHARHRSENLTSKTAKILPRTSQSTQTSTCIYIIHRCPLSSDETSKFDFIVRQDVCAESVSAV